MRRFTVFTVLIFSLTSSLLSAQPEAQQSKVFAPEQVANAHQANSKVQSHNRKRFVRPIRPVSELDPTKYLLMTASAGYDTLDFKDLIVRNLPPEITLVLLVKQGTEEYYSHYYSKLISRDRLIIAINDNEFGFWARDTFPYPVFTDANRNVELVNARYPREFNGADAVAAAVNGRLRKEGFYFVGGNLVSDQNGNCFVVSSGRLFGLTDKTISDSYGCQTINRLPHVSGIGDVDEVIRILPNNVILTTVESYVSKFESLGYTVKLLPALTENRTYANSVFLNGLVIMPTYGLSSDVEAKQIYESLGYRVLTANSEQVSVMGKGSFHCMTMTYPAMNVGTLFNALGLRKVRR